tara:strand:+ start:2114 stop:3757 length:1644 start_codon:yes stop_codon:yes gene_type:complete
MAKISNTTAYPTKSSPAGSDLVIGTDVAGGNATKTFTLQSIANLYGGSGSGTVTSVGLSAGTTGLSITSDTVNPITANGTFTLGGTLVVANGGTGLVALGSRSQSLRVNATSDGLEYTDSNVVEVVKNNTSSQILKGDPLRVVGEVAGVVSVEVAQANSSSNMPCIGLASENIEGTSSGLMIQVGVLKSINTNTIAGTGSVSVGDVVYVAGARSPGELMLTRDKPIGVNLIQNIGVITKTGAQGSIQVTAIGRTNDLPNLAQGSIFLGDSNGASSALSIGTNTYVLTSNGTTASWAAAASGGGITFSGSTTDGLATYSNSTTASVSSVFTLSGNKLSAPAGSLANPSIEVGAIGGLYAASGGLLLAHNGANAIGVSSAAVVNYKITQFDSGLKFGSSGSTLDTYTEATWSSGPTVSFSVGGSASLSASSGSYRVIGDMVFASFTFTFGSGSIGYGSVDISLPISGVAGTGSINFTKMNSNVGNSTVSTPVTGDILTNSASIRLKSFNYDQDSSTHVSGQLFELVDSAGQPVFQNGDIVSGTIIYRKQ